MLIARLADTFLALIEGLGKYISAMQIVIRRQALYKVLDFRWGDRNLPPNVFLLVRPPASRTHGTESHDHNVKAIRFDITLQGTIHMKNISIILCLVLLIALAASVTGAVITLSPVQMERGDTVTIAIQDLADNQTFSIGIEGRFGVQPGEDFTFETSRFVMPFTLEAGQIRATLYDTNYNVLEVKKGDTTVKKVGNSVNGVFSTSESGTIPAGTYDYLRLSGTPAPGATIVSSGIILEGTKKGPDDSEISFVADGISDGSIRVRALVDGSLILDRTILIGNGVAAGTAFPTTSPPPTSRPSSGGGTAGGVSAIETPVSQVITTPTTTVPASQPGEEPLMTYTSLNETTVPSVEDTPMHSAVPTPSSTKKTPLGILALLGSLLLAGMWAHHRR